MIVRKCNIHGILSLIVLILFHLNCGGGSSDYSFELQNGYSFRRWRADGIGNEIRHKYMGKIIAYVEAFNTKGNLIFGFTEKPIKYYPEIKYNREYFIIDTRNCNIGKKLSKSEWFSILSKYRIKGSQILYRPNRLWNSTKLFSKKYKIKKGDFQSPESKEDLQTIKINKTRDNWSIDLNKAGAEQLERLHSVGANIAAKICYERENNGPFESLPNLAMRVEPVTLEMIRKWDFYNAYCGNTDPGK